MRGVGEGDGGWASTLGVLDDAEMLELLDGGLFADFGATSELPTLDASFIDSHEHNVPAETAAGKNEFFGSIGTDDLAVIVATQALVDDCEMDALGFVLNSASDADPVSPSMSASNPSDSDSSGSLGHASSMALVAKPERRSRTRPKDELARLRRQETDLAAKLRELRLDARRSVVRSALTDMSSGGDTSRQHALLFWERAAARQLQHRQLSENENKRLKALLQTQIRQARHLQQLLARRLVISESLEPQRPVAHRIPPDNAEVFEALLRDIDLVYTKLEGFCVKQAGPGAAPSNWDPHSLAGATLVHPTAVDDSPFIEHCRVSSVPFHLRHVQNAVWLSMRTKTKRSTTSFFRNFAQDSGAVLRTSASLIVAQAEYPLYMQSQVAARTFTERQRVIIISKAFLEPKGRERGESLGIKFAEVNVHILTPCGDDGDDNSAPVTTIELRSTMSRYISPGPNASRWKHEGSTLMAKQIWARALAGRNGVIEEFLVDPRDQ